MESRLADAAKPVSACVSDGTVQQTWWLCRHVRLTEWSNPWLATACIKYVWQHIGDQLHQPSAILSHDLKGTECKIKFTPDQLSLSAAYTAHVATLALQIEASRSSAVWSSKIVMTPSCCRRQFSCRCIDSIADPLLLLVRILCRGCRYLPGSATGA